MAQHKMEEERRRIQEERARLLKEEKKLFEEEKEKMKENENQSDEEVPSMEESRKPNRLDRSFAEFDVLAKKKEEKELELIRRDRQFQLQEERRMFREAKKLMEDDLDSEDTASSTIATEAKQKPQKLAKSFTEFDVMEKKRKEEERNRAYKEKLRILEEEKKAFALAKRMQEESETDSQDEQDSLPHPINKPNRLSTKLTNFEEMEKQRMEKERMKAQERRIQEMEKELMKFQEERKNMNESDKEEKSEIPSPQVKQPRPKKLATSFTKFDEIFRLKQEEERRRIKEQKEKELEEERRMFMESRQAEASESENEEQEVSVPPVHRPISKMNVRQQMQSVLRAQEEMEQKRIMETKFCRMTVEQQEMFLAKEKRLKLLQEKLALAEAEYDEYGSYSSEYTEDEYSEEEEEESEEFEEDEEEPNSQTSFAHQDDPNSLRDDNSTPGSNDSGYTGAPWFTETLTNITLTEGDPVRFDAVLHADPHPKVTWYFKNRLIRNSPDYQYINRGTQYSLYMNESFVDDMGEYMCKAENCKGIATSKAILTVIEKDD